MSQLIQMNAKLKAIWKIEADGVFQGFKLNGKYLFLMESTHFRIMDNTKMCVAEVHRKKLRVGVETPVKDKNGVELCKVTLLQ